MKVIKTVEELSQLRSNELIVNELGLVPTMGALHAGHLSLIHRSVKENAATVVSIFVNPRQFNNRTDFEKYPVTIERDLAKLEEAGCDYVFLPTADDVYRNYQGHEIDFGGLDKIYEGEFRPGHFQGVVDIVYRLFDLVKPHNAYFGEKDFQQMAIIRRMVQQDNLGINIVACEIVRESSGLAMSSRNQRLSDDERKAAPEIYKTLVATKQLATVDSRPDKLTQNIIDTLQQNPLFKVEYAVFCNPQTLQKLNAFTAHSNARLCIAAWCGQIRLIDNIELSF